MHRDRKLTVSEKWFPVDNIIRNIKARKAMGGHGCETDLDEYINHTFIIKQG